MHADAPVTPRRLSSRPFTAGFLIVMIEVATVSVCPAAPFSISAQLVSIGQNFTGSSFSNSGFIPPDTMIAVGPTSFVEILNGRYAVYDKGSGSVIQTNTLNQFWSNAGPAPIKYAFDPRVVYDPFRERYLAASVDNADGPNNFLLAVSKSSDPTLGWNGFSIQSDSTRQRSADFPTLRYNRKGVYLSANMFPIQVGQITSTIVAVPKTDLIPPTPAVAHATIFPNQVETGFAVQPAVDLDNKRSSAALLSSPFIFTDQLKKSEIVDIRSPTLNTAGGFIPLSPFPATFTAAQPGVAPNLNLRGAASSAASLSCRIIRSGASRQSRIAARLHFDGSKSMGTAIKYCRKV